MRTPSVSVLVAALASLCFAAACDANTSKPPPGEEARAAFLSQRVADTVMPRLARLESSAVALHDAAIIAEASGGDDDAARDDVRAALAAFSVQWQQLEVMHFGPAGAPQTFTGGQGLRDGIHSFPLVSRCGADQQIVQNRFTESGWAAGRLVNVLGVHTLEYLLYAESDDNSCPAAASINSEGTWAALGATEIKRRRAVYARVLSADLTEKAATLHAAWRDGFAAEVSTAGQGSTRFVTAQQALDEVYAALFYVELVTKDRKLAVPAGLHVDCTTAVCPELTESPIARQSIAHIKNNLIGARAWVVGLDDDGVDGLGIDDLLRDGGHDEAASVLTSTLTVAIDAADAFNGTMEDALVSEPERVVALHAAVKGFTDELKVSVPSLLGIRVPDEGAGDND